MDGLDARVREELDAHDDANPFLGAAVTTHDGRSCRAVEEVPDVHLRSATEVLGSSRLGAAANATDIRDRQVEWRRTFALAGGGRNPVRIAAGAVVVLLGRRGRWFVVAWSTASEDASRGSNESRDQSFDSKRHDAGGCNTHHGRRFQCERNFV